jgi:hypothetical protein
MFPASCSGKIFQSLVESQWVMLVVVVERLITMAHPI